MKPISYIGLVSLLALGACSSAYRTTQTPDDVYYSPRQEQRTYAYGNGSNGNSYQDENDANYVQGTQGDGNYVTYQDDDQGDYARRLQRFGDSKYNGGYWDGYNAASNLYMSSGFYGSGLGWGYSPFYSSFYGPSLSIGMGWGWGGGFYNPWYGSWGYPYVGSYWGMGGYWPYSYYPYYGGGGWYGHGGYYGGGYYSRPSNSYGPVGGSGERVSRVPNYTSSGTNGGGGYSRPSRSGVYQPANNGGGYVTPVGSGDRPRRVFQPTAGERPANNYQPGNSGNISRPSRVDYNGGGNYSRPSRVEYSRPAPSYTPPSYSPPSSSGRVGGGGGGSTGGGGYSRPSRGGR
ncbi:hypothetical protein [Chitinophaga sp. 212800010-3]|uniref:hypothetical protein n=1 Tax=unclassified Chitinophaga TaxID=2619133 RepID=UPI002DE540F8|nr:Prolyl-tRNA synthetase [Chitinophaga sp. 212800010-3]